MRLVMMGTGSFAEPTFEKLLTSSHPVVGLVTQPDRPTGKERGSTRQARQGMKELALERGIPVFQPESVNTPEGSAALKAWQADLLVVAAYGQILSKDILGTAPRGGINVHASLLPKYRGAAPIAWAIFHGEKETGVSIIRMSTALDAGDILAQQPLRIQPQETAGELEARLAPLGADLAMRVIGQLEKGNVQGAPQDKTQVTRAPKLTKENGLIDWTRHAAAICNQVRAMQPWPTAYTFLHQRAAAPQRLIVCRAAVAPNATMAVRGGPKAGLVRILPGESQFCVETGAGDQVEILELQPAGKRRMTALEFLRGHALQGSGQLGGETL